MLGNHIVDFVNCANKRLKETFESPLAKQNGITRLEATVYNYTTDYNSQDDIVESFHPIQDCLALLAENRRYFDKAPFYAVPLYKMWTKLTDTLENTCCVVFQDILQYVY